MDKIKFPTLEPDEKELTPALNVPVVERASFPNEIASDADVIDPFDIVTSPTSDPDSNVDTPALKVPVVDKFSLQ